MSAPKNLWLPAGDWRGKTGQKTTPWIRASWADDAWGDSVEYVQADELTSLRAEVERLRAKVAKGDALAKTVPNTLWLAEKWADGVGASHPDHDIVAETRAALAEWEKP